MSQEQVRNSSGVGQDQKWFNTNQVSAMFNLSENVIRKLTAEYKPFLTMKKGRRNKNLLHQKSLFTLKKIREMGVNGLSRKDIKEQLELSLGTEQGQQAKQAQSKPTPISKGSQELSQVSSVEPTGKGRVKLTDVLKIYQAKLAELGRSLEETKKENLALKGELDSIKRQYSQSLMNQSERLSKIEDKLEQKEKKGLWARLFGRC
jgi:hypothetical protein